MREGAADEDADVWDREGEALGTLGEQGGVYALRGPPEAGLEGRRADDRPRRADEHGAVRHEVAFLGDQFVGDPLGHEPADAGVGEAQGGPGPEQSGVEDHLLDVEVKHSRSKDDRTGDAHRGSHGSWSIACAL